MPTVDRAALARARVIALQGVHVYVVASLGASGRMETLNGYLRLSADGERTAFRRYRGRNWSQGPALADIVSIGRLGSTRVPDRA